MKWILIKNEIESKGVKNDDEIDFIDIHGDEEIKVDYDHSLGYEIWST